MSPRRNRRRTDPPRGGRGPDPVAAFQRDEHERARCREKLWFAGESEARAHALMLRTQYGEQRTAYRCAHCDGWHLASGGR